MDVPVSFASCKGLVFGCRIPHHYIGTTGFGETDKGAGTDPWETGAYDIALKEAEIQDFNIIQYTSVMPKQAKKIDIEKAKAEGFFKHGAVLETIMSSQNGEMNDYLTVGVGTNKIRLKETGEVVGGFAAEYKYQDKVKPVPVDEAKQILKESLKGIVSRRAYPPSKYEVRDDDYEFYVHTAQVQKKYGTIIAAVCFLSYLFPFANEVALPMEVK